jgi:hypothetical protein
VRQAHWLQSRSLDVVRHLGGGAGSDGCLGSDDSSADGEDTPARQVDAALSELEVEFGIGAGRELHAIDAWATAFMPFGELPDSLDANDGYGECSDDLVDARKSKVQRVEAVQHDVTQKLAGIVHPSTTIPPLHRCGRTDDESCVV